MSQKEEAMKFEKSFILISEYALDKLQQLVQRLLKTLPRATNNKHYMQY